MKNLIIRVDDLGFSETVNLGIQKVCKDGIVSVISMMSNMKASVHGYQAIKEYNVQIGLHVNLSVGEPVSDIYMIPSLVNDKGLFPSSDEIRVRKEDTINIQEAKIEIIAQVEKFKEITGMNPSFINAHAIQSPHFFEALKQVSDTYGIFLDNAFINKKWEEKYSLSAFSMPSLNKNGTYDCQQNFLENYKKRRKEKTGISVFHPGYIDQYLMYNSTFVNVRADECAFLCNDFMKEFLRDEKISIKNYEEIIKRKDS